MVPVWSKGHLYYQIDKLRYKHDLSTYPLNTCNIALKHCRNAEIEYIPFPSKHICGILFAGKNITRIALNSGRDSLQRNFDCGHELIHYFYHDLEDQSLMCREGVSVKGIMEWQANEGAAELLMPYRAVLNDVMNHRSLLRAYPGIEEFFDYMVLRYNVSKAVIRNRLDSLKYELSQYMNGVPMNEIEVLSDTKQKERQIIIEPFSAHMSRMQAVYDFSEPYIEAGA